MHAHRSGTEARLPRETLSKKLFMANVRAFTLESQLDAALQRIAELEDQLERYERIDATCEALGMEQK